MNILLNLASQKSSNCDSEQLLDLAQFHVISWWPSELPAYRRCSHFSL